MGDFKTYSIGFDLTDRLTSKLDAITKKLDRLTDVNKKIGLDVDSSVGNKLDSIAAKAERANSSIQRATSQGSAGFGRMGSAVDALKSKFKGLADVADEFSNMTSSLARGDILGAGRAGGGLMGNAGKGLAAATGLSTGALLVGGGILAAGALTVPGAATWEKQLGRASKTALDEAGGYTQMDLGGDMLNTLMDVRGINQQDLIDAVGRAGSLGYSNDEAISAATVGSKAGAAFEIETGEAMRMLGVVNQMWAEQAEEIGGNIVMMEKAGSAVNVLGNKYASTESNILQFLSEAGGLAKVWKMDVAETAAIGSVLETVNIKASEGETMFRSALNAGIFQKRALQPDQIKAFRQAGVKVKGGMGYDVAGSILGISGKEFQGRLNENMADSMFSVVDAILEKAGGNDSLAQQMAESVFGSYGMGFLKLGGQRENLAEMTAEARKGFDEGTSMEEEYKRQTSNVIDAFGQTTKIIGALAKVVGGFLLPPLALLLSVFNGLLGPVAKLAIFLQNMLFKQIDKLLGKFMGTNLGQDLAKAFSAITDTAGKIWEVIGPIIVKLLEGLLDIMSGPVMMVLWLIAAIYDKVRPYILQLVEGILGILDKLKGMWNWLMDAIPGARKEEARLKLEAAAKKEGLGVTPGGSISTLDSRGNLTYAAPTTIPDNLIDLQARYQALPGFAEGIADAVKAGVSSIGDTIADRIADALPDWEMPSFDDLTAALENLPQKIKDAILGNEFTYLTAKSGGQTYIQGTDPEGNVSYWRQRDFLGIDSLRSDEVITEEDLPQEIKDQWGIGHASGITFTGTGTYFGKFHRPEEVLSQASTIRGPGIIARAMDALDGATRGSAQAGRGGEVHIHVENKNRFEFAGARFSPDFDMEAFLRMIDAKIESGSVEAAKRVIGNRRT